MKHLRLGQLIVDEQKIFKRLKPTYFAFANFRDVSQLFETMQNGHRGRDIQAAPLNGFESVMSLVMLADRRDRLGYSTRVSFHVIGALLGPSCVRTVTNVMVSPSTVYDHVMKDPGRMFAGDLCTAILTVSSVAEAS